MGRSMPHTPMIHYPYVAVKVFPCVITPSLLKWPICLHYAYVLTTGTAFAKPLLKKPSVNLQTFQSWKQPAFRL